MKNYSIIFFITLTLIYSCGRKEEAKTENTKFVLSDTMMHMIEIDTVRNCNIDDQVSLSGQVHLTRIMLLRYSREAVDRL